jgi:hypothetical protein
MLTRIIYYILMQCIFLLIKDATEEGDINLSSLNSHQAFRPTFPMSPKASAEYFIAIP